MALNAIGASVHSARSLVESVENAGGAAPAVLHRLLDAADLLVEQPAPPDPVRPVIDAAVAGELDEERLTALLAEASRDASAADYRAHIRARCESALVDRFFRALCDGAADEILDGLRAQFDEAAKQLADATATIAINVDPRQLADHGTPAELDAWRSIRPAVARLDEIAIIARRFGPRSADWAVVDGAPNLDDRALLDEAVCCSADDLVTAGAVFRARTADLRSVPWLRISPRLNSIAESKERLRVWAEAAFDATAMNQGRGRFDDDGKFVATPIKNPYAVSVP